MKYLPVVEDLEDHLPEIIAGELGLVAEALNTTRDNLERLIEHDPTAIDLVSKGRAELEALLDLRTLLLAPDALTTLEKIMKGRGGDSKTLMAQVRAAESILDRNNTTAKVTRNTGVGQGGGTTSTALPPLQDVLAKVEGSDQLAVVDRYMALMKEADEFRKGTVVPKDVTPEVIDGEVRTSTPEALRSESEEEQTGDS
jgi:hypothetical protein